jgi:hypothetical protein
MFLWVRLVLSMLLDQESINDLREAVHRLPIGLESAYGRILSRIQAQMDESQHVKAKAILSWLAFAYRPLQSFELCDALVFSENRVLDEQTKLGKGVLDICKPLIEEREGYVFALVHFSAREYAMSQVTKVNHTDLGQILAKSEKRSISVFLTSAIRYHPDLPPISCNLSNLPC